MVISGSPRALSLRSTGPRAPVPWAVMGILAAVMGILALLVLKMLVGVSKEG